MLPQLDDLTHASIGASILQTGDWFTMHEGRLVSWLKPPLYFWIEAVFFKLFSVSAYWAKLPAAVCGFLTYILVYRLGALLYGRRTGFLSVFVLSTSLFFLRYTQRVMLDMPASFAVTLALYAAVRAERGEERWFLLYGAALALGYYFKGLQGLYALGIVPLYLLLSGRGRLLLNRYLLGGFLLCAALIGAWTVPQYLTHGAEFLWSQCGIGPLAAGGLKGYTNPFYHPLFALFHEFYWAPLSFAGMWFSFRGVNGQDGRDARTLLLLWFWTILAALCVSSVFGVRYLVPLLVPAGLFAGYALHRLIEPRLYPRVQHAICGLFGLGTLVSLALPPRPPKEPTELISFYRCVNAVLKPADTITLYRERQYVFNQGLVFYSSRPLDKQILSLNESPALPAPGGRMFLVTSPADADTVLRTLPPGRAELFAAGSAWKLFRLKD